MVWIKWKWKHNVAKSVEWHDSSAQKEIYSTKCIYIRKEDRAKFNNLSFHLRKLEKDEQSKFKIIRKKSRTEINDAENRKSTEKNQQNPKAVVWKDQLTSNQATQKREDTN